MAGFKRKEKPIEVSEYVVDLSTIDSVELDNKPIIEDGKIDLEAYEKARNEIGCSK